MPSQEMPRTLIHAFVPASPSDTNRAIVTWRGTLPAIEHNGQGGTHEDTLNRLARTSLNTSFLSVKARNFELEAEQSDSPDHHIVYTSKATASDIVPTRGQRLDQPRIRQRNLLAAATRHLFMISKEGIINSYYDATIYGNYLPRHQ